MYFSGLYSDFLLRNPYSDLECAKYLSIATYILRMKIRNLRTEALLSINNNNNNPRRHLRYLQDVLNESLSVQIVITLLIFTCTLSRQSNFEKRAII